MQVASICKEAIMYCDEVDQAERFVRQSIKELRPRYHIEPEFSYRIIPVNHNFFEVWHFRADGAQEYLFASIKK